MDNHSERYSTSADVGGDQVNPERPPWRAPSNQRASEAGALLAGVFWFLATVMLVLAAWFLGPMAIERYQYAATRGRVEAEYDKARQMLGDLPLQDVSLAFQLVAQRIKPSVVSVRATGIGNIRGTSMGGQGSGVIMSSEGYIVTNHHVVHGAREVEIGLHDRRRFDGVVVGSDEASDLAVIRIQADGLLPADWGDSDALSVGSMVWAVGSPYGLEQTVTSGILSAKERGNGHEGSQEYLQTDAAVNPGNSGGPLVNARGEVVGINTSIYGEQFQGISFAIPSAVARYVYEQILKHGKVTRSYLGILPRPVSHADMTRMNLPDLNGAYVGNIPTGGPAAYSDLQEGDVIRCWDGKEVRNFNMLFRLVAMTKPDSDVQVDVLRNGQPLKLTLSVMERPADLTMPAALPGSRAPGRWQGSPGRRRNR
jgi:serine protease Do